MADCDIGLVGLGTMGAALALNIAEKGFDIAVWNRTGAVTEAFHAGSGDLADRITPTESLESLVAALKRPRAIILMRHGPSIMGGGDPAHWARVAPILTAIAADYKGTPCATLLGPEGAGHFVKAVHNGIEYADMQMIAEVYGLMRDGLGRSASDIGALFTRWNDGPLASYLVQISGQVAATTDPATGVPLLDVIVDAAGQKGTGRWTAIEAQHLGAPIPVIEAAVAARNISARRADRQAAEALKVLCYSQGFAMLAAAARAFDWDLDMPEVAKVWRAGCIIRSAMLDDMAAALAEDPGRDLIFAPFFADLLKQTHGPLREVVATAARHGIAVPALGSGLAYFDAMRTARGTANMIQGQRDFFGLHGFARLDDGTTGQHGPWA